jgi:hypothetical protein
MRNLENSEVVRGELLWYGEFRAMIGIVARIHNGAKMTELDLCNFLSMRTSIMVGG